MQNFGSAGVINVPADGSVTTSKIVDGSVTAVKMAAGAAVGNIANNTITPAMHSNSGYEFGMRNRIINGAMMIDQRNAGASGTGNANYTVDRWIYSGSQASKGTWQQNAGAVTPPVGFTNYLGFTSSSAYSIGSSDYFRIIQRIEGLNVADLAWGTANAKSVTLSFQVYSSLTGTFGGYISNSASNRCYVFSYTVLSANTWTPVSITISGNTSGTWLTTNGIGIEVGFSIGQGSTFSGSAGSWGPTIYLGPTGQTSVVGTNGATFYITGVQLEKGSVATPFEFRPYGTELALCQRYFQKYTNQLSAYLGNGNSARNGYLTSFIFPVKMRSSPTASNLSGSIS